MEYYDEVIIKSKRRKEYYNKIGYLAGVSEEKNIISSYGIFLFDFGEVFRFLPNEIEKTGKKIPEEYLFYIGNNIRVSKNGHLL